MKEYEELIAELRNCANGQCYKCSRKDEEFCSTTSEIAKRYLDAADALEAAEKRIKELESQSAFFDAEKLNYQENIEYRDERIKELEAQMPKEGEWIYTPLERYKEYKVKCPFCGAEYHDCYDGYIDAEDMNYCPNCGAKMDGERKDGEHEL